MVAPLMVSMFTIFTYVLAKHDGMAPCVQGGLLSLALCKPKVRKGIKQKNGAGDALVGLRQGSRRGKTQKIHYIAIVSQIVALAQYYAPNSKLRVRDGCIYVFSDGEMIHNGCTFHNDNEDEDENSKISARTKKALC